MWRGLAKQRGSGSLKLGQDSGDSFNGAGGRRTRRGRREGYAESEKIRPEGAGGRGGLEDKERQTESGGRGVLPQGDHSWCLTPLVLLMCDAQEIDRLCKTQPTGENNNNNTRQTHENGNLTGLCRDETAGGGRGGGGRTAALVDVTFTHSGKVS